MRRYRLAHPGRARRWYEQNPSYNREYYVANRERLARQSAARYRQNRARIRAAHARYMKQQIDGLSKVYLRMLLKTRGRQIPDDILAAKRFIVQIKRLLRA